VASAPGFEAFELLRPADDRDVYLVYTRWRSEADFERWAASPAFQHGHRAHTTEGPVGTASALWSFDVVQHEEAG
jgi:heme-degrading monooxygenase HmoA